MSSQHNKTHSTCMRLHSFYRQFEPTKQILGKAQFMSVVSVYRIRLVLTANILSMCLCAGASTCMSKKTENRIECKGKVGCFHVPNRCCCFYLRMNKNHTKLPTLQPLFIIRIYTPFKSLFFVFKSICRWQFAWKAINEMNHYEEGHL